MTIHGFEITGYQISFVALAGITVLAAIGVVFVPNILRAALLLGLTLFGVAGLYALMNAPFLAAVQVMVYVGAIVTMIVLAIFLSHQVMKIGFGKSTYNFFLAGGAALVLFLFLFVSIANSVWVREAAATGPASENVGVQTVAKMLLQPYAFPFELASVLLLAVLIGAVVIAKEDKPSEP